MERPTTRAPCSVCRGECPIQDGLPPFEVHIYGHRHPGMADFEICSTTCLDRLGANFAATVLEAMESDVRENSIPENAIVHDEPQ